jgi:hypothetical protein
VDWQLWVTAGDKPAAQYVVTQRVTGSPQFALQLRNWNTLGALLARSGDAALIRHEKEQNLTPPSFSRNDSPAVFVSAIPNLLEVSR